MIPLRATNYKVNKKWPKYIVIHHTACMVDDSRYSIDRTNAQVTDYQKTNFNYRISLYHDYCYHWLFGILCKCTFSE